MTRVGHSPTNLFADLDVEVHPDHPIGKDTWFGVGGQADMLVRPRSEAALSELVRRCHEHEIPLRVLGNGANLLVADEGVDGIVLRLDHEAFTTVRYNLDGAVEVMKAMAGADMGRTMSEAVRRGLSGLQQMAGIPASIGGAIRMNAGGAFGSIGDSVHSVACLTTRGDLVIYPAGELKMGYRETNLPEGVVLWATFNLQETDPHALKEQMLEIFQYKKSTQPSMAESSAGCAFKNPVDPATGERTSAGKLIDLAGLKGHRLGAAQVSELHGNFLVVDQGGSASDLIRLMEVVRGGVERTHGIELENEVVIWSRS
ncbi:MAG: UDP-N-acetylmuramate dehydrogenase [Planctomycetota bacterium]|nr:UDP-N-acetylmuramate dehydrogenase [Planctomycetota bacterium]